MTTLFGSDLHLGFAAYFTEPAYRDRETIDRLTTLLADRRWPWLPWWLSFSAVKKRDDRKSLRVGGKNGVDPIAHGIGNERMTTLRMERARGEGNDTSVRLDIDRRRLTWAWEAPSYLLATCKAVDLPEGKSVESWISLLHDLVRCLKIANGVLGVWKSYYQALSDTSLTGITLDTPKGDIELGVAGKFNEQRSKTSEWRKFIGVTYARYPRWGTYLNDAHVAAVGGVDKIRGEVSPVRLERVGRCTYIQLTDTFDTAFTAEAVDRRNRLEALMAPILVGAAPERIPEIVAKLEEERERRRQEGS